MTGKLITYADGKTSVEVGDRVSLRHFLRRRAGEVVHVPGVSEPLEELDGDGALRWVGVALPDEWAVGTVVSPETGRLKASVRFVERGRLTEAGKTARARMLEKERATEAAEVSADEVEAPERPKLLDWLALAFAVLIPVTIVIAGAAALGFFLRFLKSLF